MTGIPPAGTGDGREVFLSYASRDQPTAERICAFLESAGVPVWMAPRDVPGGALYADAIVRAINACRFLVLVLSQDSVDSSHVGKEIERASSKRKPVLAVRLDATELTPSLEYFLSESQWIDARAGLEPALPKLAEGVRRLGVGGAPSADPRTTPVPITSGSPRRLRIVTATAAVVLAVVAGWFIALQGGWFHKSAVPAAAAPAEPGATAAATARKSIAVMPFTDLSQEKDQEYFSDGLSQELIDLLGKVPGLRVPARTSSFYFKGKQATLAEIGKALNVTHVLEGSVRKSGKALRITTELVSVADDSRVWSETYDRQLDDVFKVQDDIASAVVTALKVSVLGESAPRVAPTASSEAYMHYLRAVAESNDAGRADAFDSVVGELQQAIKIDPSFAQAWLLLGQVRIGGFVGTGYGGDYATVRPAALEALQRALSIDPNLAAAHVQLARLYYMMDWDSDAAHRELARAVALQPNEPSAFWLSGYIADSEGRFDESIAAHLKGRDIDPLQVDNYRQLGNAYYRSGRLDEGAAILSEAIARFPNASTTHYRLGLIRLAQHRPEDALAEFNHLEMDKDFQKVGPPLALDTLGRRAEADRALAEILASKSIPNAAAYQVAIIYAHRGDADHAFQWLGRALKQRDAGMHWMKFDPLLRGLSADPRFKALLAQMHQS
ncbi:MAG TPA: TIR domain-containing protein [Steroidobacteraceae bacterium]